MTESVQTPTPSTPWRTLACLVLLLLYPIILSLLPAFDRLSASVGEGAARVLREGFHWLYALVILSLAVRWVGLTREDIHLHRPKLSTLGWGLLIAMIVFVLAGLAGHLAPRQAPVVTAHTMRNSIGFSIATALRAGVVEELLYRGLAMALLLRLSCRRWLAALLSGIAFTFSHGFTFNLIQMVPVAVATLVLTLAYLRRRDLLTNMVAHTLIDGISFLFIVLLGA